MNDLWKVITALASLGALALAALPAGAQVKAGSQEVDAYTGALLETTSRISGFQGVDPSSKTTFWWLAFLVIFLLCLVVPAAIIELNRPYRRFLRRRAAWRDWTKLVRDDR